MTRTRPEQRNPYKGSPPRPWIRLNLRAPDGGLEPVQLLADTGNSCALIIGANVKGRFKRGDAPDMGSNFVPLTGGWLQVWLTDIGFDRHLLGYGSDAVASAAKVSDQVLMDWPAFRFSACSSTAGTNGFWVRLASTP